MALTKVQYVPGIDKQDTEYGAEGRWIDCDNVRFRYGLPEKIGGWQKVQETADMVGAARDIHTWTDLNNQKLAAIGTDRKLYLYWDNAFNDITPFATTIPAEFAFTTGTTIVDVTSTSHNALLGDFVVFSTVSGVNVVNVTDADMQNEFEIVKINNSNSFQVDVADLGITPGTVTASGTAAGASFEINIGTDVTTEGFGWGALTWGNSTWNTPRAATVQTTQARIWQMDNFGEDLIATIVDGKTYKLDTSAFIADRANVRAEELTNAPDRAGFMLVSPRDRHLAFFATETTPGTSTTYDAMSILFGSQESTTDFTPTAVNTAGFQRLSSGNAIVSAVRTRGDILILTDSSAHSMQFVGPPFTFSFNQIGTNCGSISTHAAQEAENVVYWMSDGSFFLFDGVVKEIPCSVQDYVFGNINKTEQRKVYAGVNLDFSEVNWFYPSADSSNINRVVTYNYLEKVWTIGTMARTAWAAEDIFAKPYATYYDPTSTSTAQPTIIGLTAGRSRLYSQDTGTAADGEAMTAFIESGDSDIADGEDIMFVRRYIPDFKNQSGDLTMTFKTRDYPGGAQRTSSTATVTSSTTKVDTRIRGRQVAVRIESNSSSAAWRYGTLRIDAQPDGRR
jgi:hypothetical protein